MTNFNGLNLIEPLLRNVEAAGFSAPTEIQAATIPALLEGKDLMGISHTGGGKTAAFCLPLLQRLAENPQRPKPGQPRAVILAPTRELATQIGQCLRDFKKGIRLFSSVVFGGSPMGPQIQELRRGVDILVATPGRLLDHMSRNTVRFDDVEIFILDEADRMLDMGFSEDVLTVAELLPNNHQTVMFSATMPAEVKHLTDRLLKDPVKVETAPQASVTERVTQVGMFVKRHDKTKLLVQILNRDDTDRVLVFTKTKADADELSFQLRDEGIDSDAIHGDKQQRIRQKILRNFRNGQFPVLIATDVAARGIDVPGITHVVNYDLPQDADSYVHRIGRTGRGSAEGIAISFCEPRDIRLLRNIERLIKQDVGIDEDHEFHAAPPPRSFGAGAGAGGRGGRGGRDGGRGFGGGGRGGFGGRDGGRGRGGFGGGRDGARGDNRDGGRGRGFGGPRDGARAEGDRAARGFGGRDEARDGGRDGARRDFNDRPRRDGGDFRNDRKPRFDNDDRAPRGDREERSGGRGGNFRPRGEGGNRDERRFADKPRGDRGGNFRGRDGGKDGGRDGARRDFGDRPRRAEGGRNEGRGGNQGMKRRSA
ncbi:DEAD/DEAH box helicase [Thalassospira indica]|uniref:DEAD/DEAH box helicase n=1 Tax=Thalassospira indica TaxID=1891279 RepID=A0ABN5NA26_9PROT|nr:DEAD/DEAH box helicase [Thalassospira indica]AXO13336.1 DEAD/DEAH box helicase [Thalassospira indica]OAZ14789.1 DEAD/DEAH box helicase [Thalassospira profundimaris]